jgi:hypothetical protein
MIKPACFVKFQRAKATYYPIESIFGNTIEGVAGAVNVDPEVESVTGSDLAEECELGDVPAIALDVKEGANPCSWSTSLMKPRKPTINVHIPNTTTAITKVIPLLIAMPKPESGKSNLRSVMPSARQQGSRQLKLFHQGTSFSRLKLKSHFNNKP